MLNDVGKIREILTHVERRKAIAMLILVVLMAAAETLGVLSIMPFLSVLGRPEIVDENKWLLRAFNLSGLPNDRAFIIALGILSICVVLTSSVFKVISQHVINRYVHLLRHSISTRLLTRYLNQPYPFFLTRNTSDLSKNILSETDQILFELVQPLSQLIAQGAVILAMIVLVFLYDPIMALGILSTVALLYGAIYIVVRKRLTRAGADREAANRGRYQTCNEALGGIKEVKVTHSEGIYSQEFNRFSQLYSRRLAMSDTMSQTPLYIVEAVGYSGLVFIALILMLRAGDFGSALPALGLYGFAAYRMLPAAQIVYRGLAKLRFSQASLERIHRDLQLPVLNDAFAPGSLVPMKDIRLSGVHYAYPSSPERPILKDFDLIIPAGKSFGIVGRSGSGKTTVMDLLLGLLEPDKGVLSIDGAPVNPYTLRAWHRAIGYVPQHIFLLDASVAANIAFGVAEDKIDMIAVQRAARAAQLHDFIVTDLPDGYATFVGERGIRLSGGQRQRVGIARALYSDPPVLFFDEATSALDAKTEDALNEAIRSLTGKKTIVVISHNQASFQGCNVSTSIEIDQM